MLVTVSDPEDAVPPPAECLTCLFKLTPAKARLAFALTARQTVEGYAERASISIGTARWTLKRILEETGCRRQSEVEGRRSGSPDVALPAAMGFVIGLCAARQHDAVVQDGAGEAVVAID
jgi:DNA-binding CsgD family transcriptional regulator